MLGGMLVGAVGCAANSGFPVEDTKVAAEMNALMEDLQDTVNTEIEAEGLEPYGGFGGRAGPDIPPGPAQPSTMSGQAREGQVISVFGVCTEASGVATLTVEDVTGIPVECTPNGDNVRVQRLLGNLTLEDATLSMSLTDIPEGAVWTIQVGTASEPDAG